MKKSWKQIFLDMPIEGKLNIFFIALLVIPILVVGLTVSVIFRNMQLNQVENRAESSIVMTMQGINMSLSEIDGIAVSNLWDAELMRIMTADETDSSDEAYCTSILRSMANSRKDIRFIVLARRDGLKYVFESGDSLNTPEYDITLVDSRIFSDPALEKGKTVWIDYPGADDCILGVRKIYNFETLDDLGYLYIAIKESAVRKLYTSWKTTAGSFFIIQDAYGTVASENGTETYDTAGLNRGEASNEEIVLNGTHFYRNAGISEETGWIINLFTPKKEALAEVRRTELILGSVLLLLFALLLMFTGRFSETLTGPIYELQELMKEVKHENFNIHANDERQDELGALARAFNSMSERIRRLIDEDYRNKLMIQETEYKYLRAQINPHFLYNTLDSISWLAAMKGNKDVSRMAVALGRILRWSISNKRSLVMLREDMDIIQDYLMIQQMRYGESLQYFVEIGEEEKEMLIPKMILQPIVENALVHGLEDVDGDKNLWISARHDGNCLIISVRDNGVGISSEKLKTLRDGMDDSNATGGGVGIGNVNRRIRILFGEQYGLTVQSEQNKGTEVTMRLPIDVDGGSENT